MALGARMALQGPGSNYGAGLSLILTRMFKVGDTIEVRGCAGVVTEISLSRLTAPDFRQRISSYAAKISLPAMLRQILVVHHWRARNTVDE